MEKVLIDTTGLWGLTFADSKYHSFMAKLAKEKMLIAHSAQLLELFVIIYREKTNGGRNLQAGLEHVNDVASFYLEIEKLRLLGVNVSFYQVSEMNIIKAVELISRHRDLFVREGPQQTRWLEFVDAITAAIWSERGLTLYTADSKLMKFGDLYALRYKAIEAEA